MTNVVTGFMMPIFIRVFFKPVKAILGGRLRFILAGGAPLAPDTHRFIRATLCCPVLQGYGLTESCSACTIMDMEDKTTGD
jgi:long-chain acyl-CoA synthetase